MAFHGTRSRGLGTLDGKGEVPRSPGAGNVVLDASLSLLICKEFRLDHVRLPFSTEVPKDGDWGCGEVVFDLDTRKIGTPPPRNNPAPVSDRTLGSPLMSLGDQFVSLDLSASFYELFLGPDTTKGQVPWGKRLSLPFLVKAQPPKGGTGRVGVLLK